MEEYEEELSKVYIKIDAENRIIRCEGGYTTPADLTDWIYIDEGTGDRFNLCQTHYFSLPLMTEDGIYRYKYEDGDCKERSEEEMEHDRREIPPAPPTAMERIEAQVLFTAVMTDTVIEEEEA